MPFTKPTTTPLWAMLDTGPDPESGINNVTTPDTAHQDYGWSLREFPPRQFFNWLGRWCAKWIQWLDQQEDDHESRLVSIETWKPLTLIDGFKLSYVQSTDQWSIYFATGKAITAAGYPISADYKTKHVTNTGGTDYEAWVAGTGNGGVASGVPAITTEPWLHAFVIIKLSTGDTDFGFDSSIAAANLLSDSGYDDYRRVGSIKIDSAGGGKYKVREFIQRGETFLWYYNGFLDYTKAATGASKEDATLSVPPNIITEALLRAEGVSTGSAYGLMLVHAKDTYDGTPVTGNTPLMTLSAGGEDQANNRETFRVFSDTSQKVRVAIEAGSGTTTFKLVTYGYVDPRGVL